MQDFHPIYNVLYGNQAHTGAIFTTCLLGFVVTSFQVMDANENELLLPSVRTEGLVVLAVVMVVLTAILVALITALAVVLFPSKSPISL